MKVLLEPSTFDCLNMGDVAMMQVATQRLREIWPDAHIHVLTGDPHALKRLCPGVIPVNVTGRDAWFEKRYFLGRLHAGMPSSISEWLAGVRSGLGQRYPAPMARLMGLKPRVAKEVKRDLDAFVEVASDADLYLMSGSGTLNDTFVKQALRCLETISFGVRRGARSAMLGQGVGPASDPALRSALQKILPRLDLITLREGVRAPQLLEELGLMGRSYPITGDDAIELASQARPSHMGNSIGFNVRIAAHSGIGDHYIPHFESALRSLVDRYRHPILPIPIALHEYSRDHDVLRDLFSRAGVPSGPVADIRAPIDVIRIIGSCRVVVTAAYHAAVFALAQGVPVIALHSSQNAYYRWKFDGLCGLFQGGVDMLSVDDPSFRESLLEKIEAVWARALPLRDTLIQAGQQQVVCGRNAFRRLKELVG